MQRTHRFQNKKLVTDEKKTRCQNWLKLKIKQVGEDNQQERRRRAWPRILKQKRRARHWSHVCRRFGSPYARHCGVSAGTSAILQHIKSMAPVTTCTTQRQVSSRLPSSVVLSQIPRLPLSRCGRFSLRQMVLVRCTLRHAYRHEAETAAVVACGGRCKMVFLKQLRTNRVNDE